MRARTFIGILVVFALIWFAVSTARLNSQIVTVSFAFFPVLELELSMLMLACFWTGAAVILVFDVVGGAKRFAQQRRMKRANREREEVETLYVQGLDYMMNGHYGRALEQFDRALERQPEHHHALVKKGESLRCLRRFREAADVLERASQNRPDDLVALYCLSDVYREAGTQERTRVTLERIIALDPERTVSAHRKLRDLLVDKKQWEEAARVQQKLDGMITSAEERERERAIERGIRLGLAARLQEEENFNEAAVKLQAILEEEPAFVPAYVRLGEVLARSGQIDKAVELWRRGFEVTGSTEPLSALQNFYLRDEEPEEAIGLWKQALLLSEQEVPLRYCLGKLYYRLFMLDEALREFRLIEDRVSGLPALHLFIARILESKGDLSAALVKTKLLVSEVEGLMMDYACSSCEWRSPEWTERCAKCRSWGTVSLHLPAAAAPEPTIRPAPTWS